MRHSHASIAVTAAVAVLSFAAVVTGAPVPVTAVLGIALLGAPGHVWAEVLIGSRVGGLERAALAAGLALAVPVLGGVALYAARVPLHRVAWAGLLASVVLAGDAVLLIRGRPGTPGPPVRTPHRTRWPSGVPAWHAVAFGAAAVIAAGGVGLARAGAEMQHYAGFTELWLSPPRRSAHAADLGVSNHQGTAARYRLVLLRNGRVSDTWNLSLPDGHTWQRVIPFTGRSATAVNLYRLPDLARPYRHVSIDPGAGGP
jgi:hypothetical protein